MNDEDLINGVFHYRHILGHYHVYLFGHWFAMPEEQSNGLKTIGYNINSFIQKIRWDCIPKQIELDEMKTKDEKNKQYLRSVVDLLNDKSLNSVEFINRIENLVKDFEEI